MGWDGMVSVAHQGLGGIQVAAAGQVVPLSSPAHSPSAQPPLPQVPSDFDVAMRTLYGEDAVPPLEEPSCARESRPELGQWA